MKYKFLLLIIMLASSVSAYQATTAEGKQVEQFAVALKQVIADYQPFTVEKQPDWNREYFKLKKDEVTHGTTGEGAYGAAGGDRKEFKYPGHRVGKGGEEYEPPRLVATRKTQGFTGKELQGYRLNELYDNAIIIDDFQQQIAKVFNDNITDKKLSSVKNLITLNFVNKREGFKPLLDRIAGSQDKLDVNQNYSLIATDKTKVAHIGRLNDMIARLHELFTEEEYELFFNYVAAFVDHGGSSAQDADISENKSIDLPDYQKNNDILIRLTTIDDLHKIVGR